MFKNHGKSHLSGELIPVLPGIQYIQFSQRRSQMLNFLHCGPITFDTLVYDTNVEDISPLDKYYNPHHFTLWKLNNLSPHVRPRILKPYEAEEVLRMRHGFGRSGSRFWNGGHSTQGQVFQMGRLSQGGHSTQDQVFQMRRLSQGGHSTQDQVIQMGRRMSQGRPSQSQPEPFRAFNMLATINETLDPVDIDVWRPGNEESDLGLSMRSEESDLGLSKLAERLNNNQAKSGQCYNLGA